MLSCKDKLSKHQCGMLGARCQKDTNKKTSTYQRLKTNLWIFNILFIFKLKLVFSKCHLVAKNLRGEQLRNLNEVYFKDKGTRLLLDFTSSPKGWACNLRRTVNLEGGGGEQREGRFLDFLLKLSLCCRFIAVSQYDPFLPTLRKVRQLTFQVLYCQGTINHFCLTSPAWSDSFLSTVGIMTGERKWVNHGRDPLYPPLGAAAGVLHCHSFFFSFF